MTEWHESGVWQQLHERLLAELRAAGLLDLSAALAASTHLRTLKGGPHGKRARSTAASRGGRGGSTPIAAMTTTSTGAQSATARSHPSSSVAVSNTAPAWAQPDGRSSALSPGSQTSGDSASAPNDEPTSVKTHVSAILTKLDLDNRVQIALLVHDADLDPQA